MESVFGNYFVSNYPPFSCWNEEETVLFRSVLEQPPNTETKLGLYVHIPFCLERCHYCYYLSYDDRPQEMGRYANALVDELQLYAAMPALADRNLDFVYFGGGTPSLLSPTVLRNLLHGLQEIMNWRHTREVTFECAPKSVTKNKLELLRDAGVTRISMGVQQMDDSVLQRNGRVHLTPDVERAYDLIQGIGFDVINIDLIVGLVGETDGSFLNSLDRVIAMGPDSITIYQLEIPYNTSLYTELQRRLTDHPADWECKRMRLAKGFALLESCGYATRSAYTAVRQDSTRAFTYQDEQYRGADLLGIGASSFSHFCGINQQNLAALEPYFAALARNELPLGRAYVLNGEEQMLRELILQLKLGRIDCNYFRDKFGVNPRTFYEEPLEKLAIQGLLVLNQDEITLTRDGLLSADHLLPEFYLSEHRPAFLSEEGNRVNQSIV